MTHFKCFTALLLWLLFHRFHCYDYSISRARSLWAGMFNAIHYVDQLTLLSEKTPGKHGILGTYFPLEGGKTWQMDFELNWKGRISEASEGFMTLLAIETPSPDDISDYKPIQEFSNNLFQKAGVYVWISGDSKMNIVYKSLRQIEQPTNNKGSCQVDLSKNKLFLQIVQSSEKDLILGFHLPDEHHY